MNKKLKNIIFIFTFIFVLIALSSISYAASFKSKVEPKEVKIGDTITITLTADNAAGMYNVKISDTSILAVSSGSLSDFLEDESATIKLKAKKSGTVTVTTSAEDMTDLDNSKNAVTGGETYTIKVTDPNANSGGNTGGGSNNNAGGNTTGTDNGTTTDKPATKSTNAYLSTLGVTPKEYDFSGFKKSTLTYNVTVPYEVDSLKVLYKTAHSGAKVKVTGNSGFEVGSNNKITIKVTAEDGKTTKTYTIKVTKLAEEEEKPGNIIDEEVEGLYLTSLNIKGIDISPEFSKDTYAYTAKLSNIDTTEVEVNAVANREGATIEVSGNKDLVIGENTITIVVKEEDSTMQAVYQITLTKEVALTTTTPDEEVNFMSNLIDNLKNYVIIAVIVVVLIIFAIVILIILLAKENKKLKNAEIDEEHNVYQNDENEFKNNEVKKETEETGETEEPRLEETTKETETKNEGRRTRRKEKGRHSK